MINLKIRAKSKSYIESIILALQAKYPDNLKITPEDSNTPLSFSHDCDVKMWIVHSGDWYPHVVDPNSNVLNDIFVIEFSGGEKDRNCVGTALARTGRYIFIEQADEKKLLVAITDVIDSLIKESIKEPGNYRLDAKDFLSKRKDQVIALLILCQGYLAAHGVINVLTGWEEAWKRLPGNVKDETNPYQLEKSKRIETEKKEWWNPVLGDARITNELLKQVKALNKDPLTLGNLLKAISEMAADNLDYGQISALTAKVIEVYEFSKDALNTMR